MTSQEQQELLELMIDETSPQTILSMFSTICLEKAYFIRANWKAPLNANNKLNNAWYRMSVMLLGVKNNDNFIKANNIAKGLD